MESWQDLGGLPCPVRFAPGVVPCSFLIEGLAALGRRVSDTFVCVWAPQWSQPFPPYAPGCWVVLHHGSVDVSKLDVRRPGGTLAIVAADSTMPAWEVFRQGVTRLAPARAYDLTQQPEAQLFLDDLIEFSAFCASEIDGSLERQERDAYEHNLKRALSRHDEGREELKDAIGAFLGDARSSGGTVTDGEQLRRKHAAAEIIPDMIKAAVRADIVQTPEAHGEAQRLRDVFAGDAAA